MHGYLKGGQRPKEYLIWSSMIQRCLNPNDKGFRFYGGRGIGVCPRWLEKDGYANFIADVGPQPKPRASLNRIDNDGDYEPSNVIWSDPKKQARNRTNNHVLTFKGISMIVADWALKQGIKPVTLVQRLHRGWPVARALTRRVERRRPYREWTRRKADPLKPGPKPKPRTVSTRQGKP
jgi:hypothetical protein